MIEKAVSNKELPYALKEKIDSLFEQALLGAICLHDGMFMFEGKTADREFDALVGFSEWQHRKRTMSAYMLLDEITFKNSYLLLSTILEEFYCFIQYQENILKDQSHHKLRHDYKKFEFKNDVKSILSNNDRIRFLRLAHFTRNIANVLKHQGGIIAPNPSSNKGSSNVLIRDFKLKEGMDLVALRNTIKIGNVPIAKIPYVISRLYVTAMDLAAFVFDLKGLRIKKTAHSNILENILNYNIRETYLEYLKSIQQDGTFQLLNL